MPDQYVFNSMFMCFGYICIFIGWVGVGWRRRFKTPRYRFCFCYCCCFVWRSPRLAVELDRSCGVEDLGSVQGERPYRVRDVYEIYYEAPMCQVRSVSIAVSGSGSTRKQFYPLEGVIHMQ